MTNKLNHILDIQSLDKPLILQLFDKAEYFLSTLIKPKKTTDLLAGKVVAPLFFEPSTRTRNSFEIAARRLGAIVVSPNVKESALSKGESLLDMVHTMEAMGVDIFVIRSPEANAAQALSTQLKTNAAIINAGGGQSQHPTQALLDLLTIQQHKPNWASLSVAIIGDIRHSRVANSLVDGLKIMGVPDIRLVAPDSFLPTEKAQDVTHLSTLKSGLKDADVVVTLRQQHERWKAIRQETATSLQAGFLLTTDTLAFAKPDAIVMHPGPINREVEISSELADGPQSVILQQVQNGVAMRMALMELLAQ